jgi:hypothetical protein
VTSRTQIITPNSGARHRDTSAYRQLSEVPCEKVPVARGVCGDDMSPPDGTRETQNVKSGSEKGTVAGHVGDITSGAAETPL